MTITREKDAEIGRDVHLRLQRLIARLSKRHHIDSATASDYLIAGALFAAADAHALSLDDTLALACEIADSIQHDVLPSATRH